MIAQQIEVRNETLALRNILIFSCIFYHNKMIMIDLLGINGELLSIKLI